VDTTSSDIVRQDSLIHVQGLFFVVKVSKGTHVMMGIQLCQGFSTENLERDAVTSEFTRCWRSDYCSCPLPVRFAFDGPHVFPISQLMDRTWIWRNRENQVAHWTEYKRILTLREVSRIVSN
jgi:hypothetical protein